MIGSPSVNTDWYWQRPLLAQSGRRYLMRLILLSKRVHRIFPDADVRVKPMMTLPAINTDASKHEKEQISRTVQEMFEEADMWLVSD